MAQMQNAQPDDVQEPMQEPEAEQKSQPVNPSTTQPATEKPAESGMPKWLVWTISVVIGLGILTGLYMWFFP